ncbi:MAG: hypothetical protein E4H13_09270 [Calditrichales bacterium]|nr:MAG: hypothetical protein E4H13_09270 [Calditrichales bacterium]
MNQKDIDQILEKISQSNEFQGGDNYQRLLRYLTEKSLSGVKSKESSIAFDVFDKEITAGNSESSGVRVYMHNLRQKLDSYYLNEGREDKIRLKIPKGHYQVKFESTATDQKKDYNTILLFTNLISLSIILTGVIVFFFYNGQITKNVSNEFADDIIWSEYLGDTKPILLVIGDYYLYEDITLPKSKYVRDFSINSAEDFQQLISEHPEYKDIYRASTHTFVGKFALICLSDLSRFFHSQGKEINVILGSNLVWEDLIRNNVIFVGSFKTLRLLKNLLNNHHYKYIIHPNTLIFADVQNDTTYAYQAPKDHATGQVKDYAIFDRFQGPNQNVITIFSSTHDVGHISTVRYFTNPETIKEFEKNCLEGMKVPYYFDALFEVQGYARTGFQPKLLHMAELN